MTSTAGENTTGYREPTREAPKVLRYGPFVPAPTFSALTLALLALGMVALLGAESDAHFTCWRDAPGDTPRCERRSRPLLSLETPVERVIPVILEHDGTFDVLRYDGITLLLPNAPPGPFSAFLNAPDALRMESADDDAGGLFGACVLFVLAAFFLPRAFVGTAPRRLIVDRARDLLRAPGAEIPLGDIAWVLVETFEGRFSRALGARVALERVDGTTVPLAPYGRPWRVAHERVAHALAQAIGVDVVVRASADLRDSPPLRHPVLAAQVFFATLVLAVLIMVARLV